MRSACVRLLTLLLDSNLSNAQPNSLQRRSAREGRRRRGRPAVCRRRRIRSRWAARRAVKEESERRHFARLPAEGRRSGGGEQDEVEQHKRLVCESGRRTAGAGGWLAARAAALATRREHEGGVGGALACVRPLGAPDRLVGAGRDDRRVRLQ